MKTPEPEILIIIEYHPEEIFATKTGELLLKENKDCSVRVERYKGKPDKGKSSRNLRRFIGLFNPRAPAIVLHADDNIGQEKAVAGVIIGCSKSKEERKKTRRILENFVRKRDDLPVIHGMFLTLNSSYSWFDIELNPNIGLKRTANLVKAFYKYIKGCY